MRSLLRRFRLWRGRQICKTIGHLWRFPDPVDERLPCVCVRCEATSTWAFVETGRENGFIFSKSVIHADQES